MEMLVRMGRGWRDFILCRILRKFIKIIAKYKGIHKKNFNPHARKSVTTFQIQEIYNLYMRPEFGIILHVWR